MGRFNSARLYARVISPPRIYRNNGKVLGMVSLDTVRGKRLVEDKNYKIKHDEPIVITEEELIVNQIENWQENDVVLIKGTVNTKILEKRTICSHCGATNRVVGNMVYVTPISVKRVAHFDNKEAAVEEIVRNQEISNEIQVFGTLTRDPKIFTTARKIQVTQYPIALDRNFIVRHDDPNIRTDWPFVKSYGEQAREDKIFLRAKASILVDGYLQARSVKRKCKCPSCGEFYEWNDKCMEIVPYDVEYIAGHRSKEEVESENKKTVEELQQILYTNAFSDTLDDDEKTSDVS